MESEERVMEQESNQSKETYIRLLIDTSKRKLDILRELMSLTEQQETILNQEFFDEDSFSQTLVQKQELLNRLNEMDNGFERLYSNVRNELKDNKYRYEIEITTMQKYISEITDYSVKLQVLEQRNKTRLELVITAKRKEIRSSKVSSQTASKYYKTMTNQNEVQSFFYDKKK